MKKIFLALMIMAPVMTLVAQEQEDETSVIYLGQQQDSASVRQMSLSDADSAYIQGDYLTAISIYKNVIEAQDVSATLYMNLGNSYFKLDEIAQAILWYERAYLLDPSDPDVKFNLELARTKTG